MSQEGGDTGQPGPQVARVSQPKPEVAHQLQRHDSENIRRWATAKGHDQFVADSGSMKRKPIAPLPRLLVPHVHARQELDGKSQVRQPQRKILFFGTVGPGSWRIIARGLHGGQSQQVTAADEHGAGSWRGARLHLRPIGRQDVESDGREPWVLPHSRHGHSDFIALQKPRIVVETDIEFGVGRPHQMIATGHITQHRLVALPPHVGMEGPQRWRGVGRAVVNHRDLQAWAILGLGRGQSFGQQGGPVLGGDADQNRCRRSGRPND